MKSKKPISKALKSFAKALYKEIKYWMDGSDGTVGSGREMVEANMSIDRMRMSGANGNTVNKIEVDKDVRRDMDDWREKQLSNTLLSSSLDYLCETITDTLFQSMALKINGIQVAIDRTEMKKLQLNADNILKHGAEFLDSLAVATATS